MQTAYYPTEKYDISSYRLQDFKLAVHVKVHFTGRSVKLAHESTSTHHINTGAKVKGCTGTHIDHKIALMFIFLNIEMISISN